MAKKEEQQSKDAPEEISIPEIIIRVEEKGVSMSTNGEFSSHMAVLTTLQLAVLLVTEEIQKESTIDI